MIPRRCPIRVAFWAPVLSMSLAAFGSASCDRRPVALTADVPLHLEARLEAALVEGSAVPADVPAPVTWYFAEPQPEWKVMEPWEAENAPPDVSRTEDALRITLGDIDVTDEDNDTAVGGIYIEVPDWKRDDWAHVQVRARSDADVDWMGFILGFNLKDKSEVEEGAEDEELHGTVEESPVCCGHSGVSTRWGRWPGRIVASLYETTCPTGGPRARFQPCNRP